MHRLGLELNLTAGFRAAGVEKSGKESVQHVAALLAHLWEPRRTCTAPEPLRVSSSGPSALAMEGGGFSQTSFTQVTPA